MTRKRRFQNLRNKPVAQQDNADLARELNIILRTTKYESLSAHKEGIARCLVIIDKENQGILLGKSHG